MPPASRDVEIYRGDTWAHSIDFEDANSAPVNMSGKTWLCQVRASTESSTVLATVTVDTTNAATGTLVLRLTAMQTADLPTQVLRWDLQETTGGTVTTWLAGRLTVTGDVSRV